MTREVRIGGTVEPPFERVREAFAEGFRRGEVGAALAVTLEGKLVIDLWGGFADRARSRPFQHDTLVNVYSTTKGMTALCANHLLDRGLLELDAAVASYWPEFAESDKSNIPVRYLLSHQAGLAALTPRIAPEQCYDWAFMTAALAAQRPWWRPGTRHGYHLLSFGYLIGELVRRIDGRTLGTYFREMIAGPLRADVHIGLDVADEPRCAEVIPVPAALLEVDKSLAAAARDPESLTAKALWNPLIRPSQVNTRRWRAAEIPSVNGHSSARGLARIYGALGNGGALEGVRLLSPDAIALAGAEQAYGPDEVLPGLVTRLGLGFFLTQPRLPFGPNPRAFGHPGHGGSVAFADPDARLGFAYVMNQLQAQEMMGGGRGFDLIRATYEAIG
ncbi:MAG TPA: serine hydrolase domain-containing protein [Polyangiaceae bacterium]|nr:serine hydrolase domain-containing protein [Polyangiaceae bacterium]